LEEVADDHQWLYFGNDQSNHFEDEEEHEKREAND